MTPAKEQAREVIDQMPDTASWEDIMYQVYVRAKISQGRKDVEQGNLIAHEEIKKEFCK